MSFLRSDLDDDGFTGWYTWAELRAAAFQDVPRTAGTCADSPKTRQKLGQNRSRASEPRTRAAGTKKNEVPAKAHDLPSQVARPTGFEPVTFGSVGGASTSPRCLFPPRIACTDACLAGDTSGHERPRGDATCSYLVPTCVSGGGLTLPAPPRLTRANLSMPPPEPPDGVARHAADAARSSRSGRRQSAGRAEDLDARAFDRTS